MQPGHCLRILLALALLGPLAAQQRRWQHPPVGVCCIPARQIAPFGDYDGDGEDDMLVAGSHTVGTAAFAEIWNMSGSRLWPGFGGPQILSGGVHFAGDMDGDGSPDFISAGGVYNGQASYQFIDVWSPRRNAVLWRRTGGNLNVRYGGYGYDHHGVAANLDVTGDGRPDVIVITESQQESDVWVYDNSGAIYYRIPALSLGWITTSVAAMPDIDNDGADDFVVGALQPGIRGAVFAFSGRTGSIIHFNPDFRVGDVLGGSVSDAGDIDGDGVHDYATASYWSSPLTQIAIFSGATGHLLRNWDDYWTGPSGLLGNVDVDLDGIPDLMVGNGGWAANTIDRGQIRAYSGRDGSVLWNHDGQGSTYIVSPTSLVNLGTHPGSPYPVLGWNDYGTTSTATIQTIDTHLFGQGPVSGLSHSSTSELPQIGLRQLNGNARITVSGGTPGSLAWLVGGFASDTSYAGIPIPIALDPFGWTGCSAFVAPAVSVPTILGSTSLDRGYAHVDLPLPVTTTGGLALAAQWLLLDPSTGSFGVTQRHDFRLR
ncbi:MAG: VCBS repeat-containing protein [Planctomycetota bacterium]